MAVTTQKLTFADYLAYADGSGTRYELVDGDLVPMGIGTGLHGAIAEFLTEQFKAAAQRLGQPWTAKDMRIGVRSPRGTRWDTSRIPDVVLLPTAQWEALRAKEAVIELTDPPPLLVVEVVSDSTVATDYRTKHSEYSVLDIPEYWIVDPLQNQVTIGRLQSGRYDDEVFTGSQTVQCSVLPGLTLTAQQILSASLA
ncbi:Uma2 family endonuclease [Nodosilinea sp. LEGE 06152]|uniref:Uma2 family endonuclease n=1 Tax=Nodosilinea sp. LEGE 06152 TaxID=2777966 RepID=UPI00187F3DFB|nr:Uma2 family endonuclease [Nodosilinea sp. LEGE 06152]MBE9156060.1 Uma2 family endonuclease [Nodosilinea sp. LEGE 06152]